MLTAQEHRGHGAGRGAVQRGNAAGQPRKPRFFNRVHTRLQADALGRRPRRPRWCRATSPTVSTQISSASAPRPSTSWRRAPTSPTSPSCASSPAALRRHRLQDPQLRVEYPNLHGFPDSSPAALGPLHVTASDARARLAAAWTAPRWKDQGDPWCQPSGAPPVQRGFQLFL